MVKKASIYCAVQKNSAPAAAGAVATSHTVFLLNIVQGDHGGLALTLNSVVILALNRSSVSAKPPSVRVCESCATDQRKQDTVFTQPRTSLFGQSGRKEASILCSPSSMLEVAKLSSPCTTTVSWPSLRAYTKGFSGTVMTLSRYIS